MAPRSNRLQCKDLPEGPILRFLYDQDGKWCTHGKGYSMPTVADVMPPGTPDRLQVAKMSGLIRRGLVDGCGCGCRGDYTLTDKGWKVLAFLEGE